MLLYDMAGKLIPPSRLGKEIGGNVDNLTLPEGLTIPTTGDFAGVTVGEFAGDVEFAKRLTRTTQGKAGIEGPAKVIKGRHKAILVRASIIGGGSSSTSGQTRRSLRVGIGQTSDTDGLYLEYRDPNKTDAGTYITAVKDGVHTRVPINYQVNNPSEHYDIRVFCSRNWHPQTGNNGWTVTLFEGERPRHEVSFDDTQIDLDEVFQKAICEWEWTHASGSFLPHVAFFSQTTYWEF